MSITKRQLLITGAIVVAGYLSWIVIYNATHKPTMQTPGPITPVVVDSSPTVDELWLYTNNERQLHGEAPLTLDPRLTASATAKCVDMVVNNYWAHTSPSGKTPQDFISEVDPSWKYSGENLSLGYSTSKTVVDAWIASPGHEANILDNHYVDVGYAICTDNQSRIMVVQQFIGDSQ